MQSLVKCLVDGCSGTLQTTINSRTECNKCQQNYMLHKVPKLLNNPKKQCKICLRPFEATGRKITCSDKCSIENSRKGLAKLNASYYSIRKKNRVHKDEIIEREKILNSFNGSFDEYLSHTRQEPFKKIAKSRQISKDKIEK